MEEREEDKIEVLALNEIDDILDHVRLLDLKLFAMIRMDLIQRGRTILVTMKEGEIQEVKVDQGHGHRGRDP
jgi:hypothetical protein